MKFLVVVGLCLTSFFSNASVTIKGTVVDGSGKPVSKCDIFFNKEKWISDDSVHVTCNEYGQYEAKIDAGHYNSMYVCDEDKYAKTALEFWGWNLNFTESQTLDVAFDAIEVFSLSAWASNGGSNSIFTSFRPMLLQNSSATQAMKLSGKNFYHKVVEGRQLAIFDISPTVSFDSIVGTLNSNPIELLSFFWSYEKMDSCKSFPKGFNLQNGCYMPMIIAQFKKPKLESGQHTLKIRLTDNVTKQMGEGITHLTSNKSGYGF